MSGELRAWPSFNSQLSTLNSQLPLQPHRLVRPPVPILHDHRGIDRYALRCGDGIGGGTTAGDDHGPGWDLQGLLTVSAPGAVAHDIHHAGASRKLDTRGDHGTTPH